MSSLVLTGDKTPVVRPATPAEQTLRDIEEAAWLADTDKRQWLGNMEATDAAMPRSTEDVIGTMSDSQKAKLPEYTKDAYAAKVTLRGQKP